MTGLGGPTPDFTNKINGDQMRTLKILGLLMICCFTALAAIAQESTADSSKTNAAKVSTATVYVYRYKQYVGSALAPSVYCDEAELARMANGRYFAVKLDPGKHNFRSNDKQSGIELDMKAGQEYFLRVELVAGAMKGHGRLVLMSPEQGSYEVKSSKLKPLDSNKVVNPKLVSVDEAAPDATPKPAVLVDTH
jgi:hypothetical protein